MDCYLVVFALGIAVSTALPTDHVIAKLDPGPRYQYMVGGDGTPELVDLWLKTSDVLAAARYNPSRDNGYHLFTRSNPLISQPIPLGHLPSLQTSNFDVKKKIVFLTHGWKNTPTSEFNVNMVHAYIAAEDVNLFMVDWSIGANVSYVAALNTVVSSAEHVAQYIKWLNSATGATLSQYHIVGHSLGAHQAGMIGKHLGGVVPYLTGMDPAGPGWSLNANRLIPADAIYTEAIHTNAFYFGIATPCGHVDFYPNGGSSMPGCEDAHCNHHRVIYYMAESLTRGGFVGQRCESYLHALNKTCVSSDTLNMGGTVAKTGKTGVYYLGTNAELPYSQAI